MISIPELEQRSKELQKEIEQIESDVKSHILIGNKEHLVVRTFGDTYKYYSATRDESGKKHEHYLNKSGMDRALKLALHDFNSVRRTEAIKEKKYVDGMLELLRSESASVKYLRTHPGQAELINEKLKERGYECLRMEDREIFDAVEDWKKQEYRKSVSHLENLKFDTVVPGLKVRSKSEALMVALFEKRHVAYHYEEAFDGTDQYGRRQTIYSDFRCKNIRANRLVIIEHLGMVDSEEYMKNVYWREKIYRSEGYYLGKNLLVTTETRESPVDLDYVNYIIDHWLI